MAAALPFLRREEDSLSRGRGLYLSILNPEKLLQDDSILFPWRFIHPPSDFFTSQAYLGQVSGHHGSLRTVGQAIMIKDLSLNLLMLTP